MKKNFTPLFAIIIGLVLIIVSIMLDGNILSFWSLSSLIITVVGSFCALIVSYPTENLKLLPKITNQVFMTSSNSRAELVPLFSELSKVARREGLLSLEDKISNMDDPFLKKGLQMVVDAVEPEMIREILELEVDVVEERHKIGQDMFKTWGELAPAFGMIGTLIGLIIMLADMQDATKIGTGMATALITTFYGALMANLVLVPMANRLRIKTEEEVFEKEMMIEGILSIQSGINPRMIEEKLSTYLSPKERLERKSLAQSSVAEDE